MSGWITETVLEAAARVVDDFNTWAWLRARLGFDPCDPALWNAGIYPGAVRACDLNGEGWQVTGLPRGLAKTADRAVVTLPVFIGDDAVEVFALDPLEPLYQRHLTDLVPVMPHGIGGTFFPVPDRVRLHGSLLDWLIGTAQDLISGAARDVFDTGRIWVGDWRSTDAMGVRAAIGLGRSEAVCDSERHARALHDMLRPPRPKLKLGIAAGGSRSGRMAA